MEAFLAHSFALGGAEMRIAAKAGVALFPDDGATPRPCSRMRRRR
jgi:hypothetical protein